MSECRYPTCSNEAEGSGYSGRFCSTECELKYDHVKADAQDAARAEQDGGYHDEPHPEEVRR